MTHENVEYIQDGDRSRWTFPDDYLDDMVRKCIGVVGASTDRTNPRVTEPIRSWAAQKYPELNGDKTYELARLFLNNVRRKRREAGRGSGGITLASHRKKRSGGNYG